MKANYSVPGNFHFPYFHDWVHGITSVFGLVMTLALSFLSYHFFEFPILRLKDRFTSSNVGG